MNYNYEDYKPPYLTTTFNYTGEVETLPEEGNIGDFVLYDGQTYINTGSSWQPISNFLDEDIKGTTTVCPHCGAPVNPYGSRCEYCGGFY